MPMLFRLSLVCLIALYASACSGDDDPNCLTPIGGRVSEVTNLSSSVTAISNEAPVELRVVRGAQGIVTITAAANLIPEISLQTLGQLLLITSDSTCFNGDNVTVEVSLPRFQVLTHRGSGSAFVGGFQDQDVINLKAQAAGDIRAQGLTRILNISLSASSSGSISFTTRDTAQRLSIGVEGSGNVSAFEAPAGHVSVGSTGTGEAQVTALQRLNVSLNSSGNVRYRGRPMLDTTVTGSGQLIDAN